MSHGHSHGGSEVHGADYQEIPAVHPAGATDSGAHHGHTIVPRSTLMAVLLTLLFFTLLTVGLSWLEEFIAHTFDFIIPAWVNVVVALSIAVVKTTLVVLFFMQLKYDNPINGLILIFCICTVACFLGFTMLDLGNRETIDRFKGTYEHTGGMGLETAAVKELKKENPGASVSTSKAITDIAKDVALLELDKHHEPPHEGHGKKKSPYSNSNQSRPVKEGAEAEPAHEGGAH